MSCDLANVLERKVKSQTPKVEPQEKQKSAFRLTRRPRLISPRADWPREEARDVQPPVRQRHHPARRQATKCVELGFGYADFRSEPEVRRAVRTELD